MIKLIKTRQRFVFADSRACARSIGFASLAVLGGCANIVASLPIPDEVLLGPSKPFMSIFPTAYKNVPGWKSDNHSEALPAFLKSCNKILKLPKDKALGNFDEMGIVSDWLPLCLAARTIRPGNKTEAQYFFESRFVPYSVSNNKKSEGLFTGYYEPDLRGAFGPDARYRYPIYARPKDLISSNLGQFDDKFKGNKLTGRIKNNKFIPYFTRGEIEDGALKGRQLETVWVDNQIDAFVLHIQGSGRIVLPNGSHVRVGFAGKNGKRYTSVGRELVAAGVMNLADVTMPSIRAWMETNPLAAVALMRKNKSFIFFKVSKNAGPIGAQGVVLTPQRSMAVDRTYYPMGLPIWLNTTLPGTREKLRRLMVTQDTGSAIKGPVRGDFFWGNGRQAGINAGLMKERGEIYLLLPKSAARHLLTN